MGGQAALWAVGAALFVLLAVRLPFARHVGGAEIAGYVFGALMMALAIGCAIWGIVYFAARRGHGRPFLSPWILFIAAGVGLLANLGAAHDRYSATHARTEHVLGAQHTKVSKSVRTCAAAAMDEYDHRSARGESVPFTRGEFQVVAGRYCEQAEAKGYFTHEPTEKQRVALMARVIKELKIEGALPETAGAS